MAWISFQRSRGHVSLDAVIFWASSVWQNPDHTIHWGVPYVDTFPAVHLTLVGGRVRVDVLKAA